MLDSLCLYCRYEQEILAATEKLSITQVSIEPDGTWRVEDPKPANGKRKRSQTSADSDSDMDLVMMPRKSHVKLEPAPSPFSPLPALSASASSTGRSHSTSIATPKAKRQSVVIDLTLSDDDDEPSKQRQASGSSNQHVSSKPKAYWPPVSSVSFPVPASSHNNSPPSSIFMNNTLLQLPNGFQAQSNSRSSLENDVWGLLDPHSPLWQTFTPPENHHSTGNGS
jgi:hypothetical protein